MRTQENYGEVPKAILRLKNNNRILLLTLFNTGGRDLPGAREIENIFFCEFYFSGVHSSRSR